MVAVNGYPDNTFRPYNNTTRGQASKIVVLAFGFDPANPANPANPTFTDAPPGSTFYTYGETDVDHGIINGYPDGTFRPYNNTTRR